jgi:drug/metabolite transporter, DME family
MIFPWKKRQDITSVGLGTTSLVLAALLYSSFGILTRMIGFELPLFYQAMMRDLFAVLVLGAWVALTHDWKKVTGKDWKWIFLRSFVGALAFFSSYYAFYYLPIGTAYFLFYSGSTIGGYLIGMFLFKELLTPTKLVSLALIFIGLALIYSLAIDVNKLLFVLVALFSGLTGAAWNTFSKKTSSNYSATQLNFLDFLFSLLFTSTLSLMFREEWVVPTLSKIWVANLLLISMFILTGQLLIYGFKHLEAQVGSLVLMLELVFGIYLGYLIFNEPIGVPTAIGGALIVLGIALPEVALLSKKKK